MPQSKTAEERISQLEARLKSDKNVTAFILTVLLLTVADVANSTMSVGPSAFGSTISSSLLYYINLVQMYVLIPALTFASCNSIMKIVDLIGRINRLRWQQM